MKRLRVHDGDPDATPESRPIRRSATASASAADAGDGAVATTLAGSESDNDAPLITWPGIATSLRVEATPFGGTLDAPDQTTAWLDQSGESAAHTESWNEGACPAGCRLQCAAVPSCKIVLACRLTK